MSESHEPNGGPRIRRATRVAGARQRSKAVQNAPAHTPMVRRASTWIIGVVVAGLATGIGTLVASAVGGGAHAVIQAVAGNAPTASSTPRTTGPVQIEYVGPVDSMPDGSFALPASVSLTAAQLADASRLNNSGSVSDHEQLISSLHGVSPSSPWGGGKIEITVRGAASDTVTITGMDVVKRCSAPLAGTFFYSPPAGADTSIGIGFDLDSPISTAQTRQQYGSISGSFFAGKVITLQYGEVQTLNVTVETEKHYCTFYFELHVAAANGSATEKIDDNGEPFAVTAIPFMTIPYGVKVPLFSAYSAVYIGGVADYFGKEEGAFMRVNPKTYDGLSNPASFPPTP